MLYPERAVWDVATEDGRYTRNVTLTLTNGMDVKILIEICFSLPRKIAELEDMR